MTGQPTTRQTRWQMLLFLAAICAPWIAAGLSYLIALLDAQTEIISTRTVCGVIIGQLIGLRRGNIQSFLIGPVVGLAAGILDLKAFLWLFEQAAWSISHAAMAPVWGAVIGIWVASFSPSWRGRMSKLAVLTVADVAARWLWGKAFETQWLDPIGQYIWLVAPLVLLPTAVIAVMSSSPRR
jgi:hypothetical protein